LGQLGWHHRLRGLPGWRGQHRRRPALALRHRWRARATMLRLAQPCHRRNAPRGPSGYSAKDPPTQPVQPDCRHDHRRRRRMHIAAMPRSLRCAAVDSSSIRRQLWYAGPPWSLWDPALRSQKTQHPTRLARVDALAQHFGWAAHDAPVCRVPSTERRPQRGGVPVNPAAWRFLRCTDRVPTSRSLPPPSSGVATV
jgi:hypothetical protein